MRRITAMIGLAALLAAPALTWAHEDYSSASDNNAMSKLGRGFAGVTTGFLELPGNMVAVGRDEGALGAMTIGFAKGLGMIPVRELVGVYEIVSSPFPPPGHYEPVLDPQYPWSYFEGAHSARMSAAVTGETRHAHHSDTTTATSGARR
jgi:putative exosortase-associated protein (TIGR04073 family)